MKREEERREERREERVEESSLTGLEEPPSLGPLIQRRRENFI